MKITILFFGVAHELTGVRHLPFELVSPMNTEELRRILADRYAGLNSSLGYAMAVNEVFCNELRELKDGDVVAILPPVSGG